MTHEPITHESLRIDADNALLLAQNLREQAGGPEGMTEEGRTLGHFAAHVLHFLDGEVQKPGAEDLGKYRTASEAALRVVEMIPERKIDRARKDRYKHRGSGAQHFISNVRLVDLIDALDQLPGEAED